MSSGSMEQRTAGMKKQTKELIEQAHQRGYKEGVESCLADADQACKKSKNDGITEGRNEAWEAAKKISSTESYKLYDIFEEGWFLNIFNKYSASEAIEKLHTHEEQKKQEEDPEIHVGDEVLMNSAPYKVIVLKTSVDIYKDGCTVLFPDGSTGVADKSDLKKTGRTFPEIAEVLKKMQENATHIKTLI